jgi:N-acetylglutamate synthase-like GNAT family acetyltransferase
VSTVYLLTESATDFFASQRGYAVVDRAAVPQGVAQHRQFARGCCGCASTMMKALR